MTSMPCRVVCALAALLAVAGQADAARPTAPFELDVAPLPVRRGDVTTLRVRPTPAVERAPDGRLDVYIRRTTPSGVRWYLTPDGAWSRTLVAHRRDTPVRALTVLEGRFKEEEDRLGWMAITVWFVRASASPLQPASQPFRPIEAEVLVRPSAGREPALFALAWAGPLTLIAWALVVFLPARSRGVPAPFPAGQP
jgi:hypothetical protein